MNSITQSRISQSSLIQVVLGGQWIKSNLGFFVNLIISLILVTLACYFFFPYSLERIEELLAQRNLELITILLYFLIFFFAVRAIILVVQTISKIEIESAIASRVYEKSDAQLREVRADSNKIVSLDKLKEYIPDNPNFKSGMARLFSLIISEAKDRRFESSTTLMEPYRDESHGDLFKIGIFQKIALQLGILGTFIGLINAFRNLKLGELENSLSIISDSLSYAFSTSIAGLVAAILIGVLLVQVRKKQEGYFRIMETASSTLVSVARNSLNHDKYLASLKQVGAAVEQNSSLIEKHQGKVEAQTEAIAFGMEELSKAKLELEGFLKNLANAEADFIRKMDKVYATLSPENMSDNFKKSLQEATHLYFKETKEKYAELNQLVSKSSNQLVTVDRQMKNMGKYVESMTKQQDRFIAKVTGEDISEHLQSSIQAAANSVSRNLNDKINEVNSKLVAYQSELSNFNENTHSFLLTKNKNNANLVKVLIGVCVVLAGVAGYFFYQLNLL